MAETEGREALLHDVVEMVLSVPTGWRDELLREVVAAGLEDPEIAAGMASVDRPAREFSDVLLGDPAPLWDAVAPEVDTYVQAREAWDAFETWAKGSPEPVQAAPRSRVITILSNGAAATGLGVAVASLGSQWWDSPLLVGAAGVLGGLVGLFVNARFEDVLFAYKVDQVEVRAVALDGLDPAAPRPVREARWRDEEETRRADADGAREALRARLLERAVLPGLRALVTEALAAPYELVLAVADAPGLGQLSDPTAEITSAVRDDVDQILGRLEAGTVGVAGPRGAGKTTLLAALEEGRLKPGGREFATRCFVKAPVRYDTREFLLHLIRELCEKAVPRIALPPPDRQAGERRRSRALIGKLAASVATGVAVGLFLSRYHPTPACIGVGIAVGLPLAIVAVLSEAGWLVSQAIFAVFSVTNSLGGLMFGGVATLALVEAPGLVLAWDGRDGRIVTSTYLAGLVLAAGLLALLLPRLRLDQPSDPLWPLARDLDTAEGREIVRRAAALYEMTRYQLTYSSSLGGKVGIDLKPIAAELSATNQRTVQVLPLTLPEIVDAFADFATLVGRQRRILVCIDELDKLGSIDEVEDFLNDIKAVFDVPNCCYVVSVSEEALASFERRGLRQRTAIDSAFDDMIRIDYVDWTTAEKLLDRRVARVPPMFWALCHALAGGLPRDLVRTARGLFRARQASRTGLAPLATVMVGIDLQNHAAGTLQAFRALATGHFPDPAVVRWADELRELGLRLEATDETACPDLVLRTLAPATFPDLESSEPAADVVQQLAAQVFFLATTLEVFASIDGKEDVDRLRLGRPAQADLLARARRDAMHGPNVSWVTTNRFREQWKLQLVDRPWGSPPAAPAPA